MALVVGKALGEEEIVLSEWLSG